MTRVIGPDCLVKCNFKKYTHTHAHTHTGVVDGMKKTEKTWVERGK